MFDNIGGKIKTLAAVECWVGIIASIISGIVVGATDEDMVLIGLLIVVAGSLSSWASSLVIYGFGQLVENSDFLVANNKVEKVSKVEKTETPRSSQKTDIKKTIGKCDICGNENVPVSYIAIKDELGTRYRNVCADCIENKDEKAECLTKDNVTKFVPNPAKTVVPNKDNDYYSCPKCGCTLKFGQKECLCSWQMDWSKYEEKTNSSEQTTSVSAKNNIVKEDTWVCDKCKKQNIATNQTCWNCGAKFEK